MQPFFFLSGEIILLRTLTIYYLLEIKGQITFLWLTGAVLL